MKVKDLIAELQKVDPELDFRFAYENENGKRPLGGIGTGVKATKIEPKPYAEINILIGGRK